MRGVLSLRSTTAFCLILCAAAFGANDMNTTSIRIVEPRDGDVLNRNDGEETAESLRITVRGVAPEKGRCG